MNKDKLTPEQYHVTQENGTEKPFSGEYCDKHDKGNYHCVVCGEDLFSSDTKYDSGSGWPSFWQTEQPLAEKQDATLSRMRTEVRCPHCDAHLGHVFDDGPQPTGLRYCINSAALKFKEKK